MPQLSYPFSRLLFVFLSLTLLVIACVPPDPNAKQTTGDAVVSIDLRNPKVQAVYNFRDRHQTDSLMRYLKHPNATLRYIAALSFASLRDSVAIEALTPLMRDPVEEVRIAAAFSMGQIGSARGEQPLIAAFVASDSLSEHQRFNAIVLESIGKCGTLASLKNIAAITTYQPSDTLLLQGQCRAIYRFGTRGITDPSGTERMVRLAANEAMPEPARLLAAHYLARTKNLVPDSAQTVLMTVAYVRTNNPDIRMALATGLGKSTTGAAFNLLSKMSTAEQDWRVKCNIINALAKFSYDTVRNLVVPLITDANPHVSRTAAEFFIANGRVQDADYYWRIARDNGALPWQTQVALYRASNHWLSGKNEPESKDYVNYRLREIFQNSKNAYEKAACLQGLSEFGWQYRYIHDKGFTDAQPVVKSAAAEALLTIMQRPDFYSFFGESSKGVRRELYYYLREIVASGDAGMIAGAADGFRVEALNYRSLRDSARVDDFTTALQKLKMPRDVEAYQALEKTIAYFNEQPMPKPYTPGFNHPIDWNLFVTTISAKTRAVVQTNKGSFTMELFSEWAPGSVSNFVQLAKDGFFDKKPFHRVVPNFVVQGGCPRGDGYGALDYTIRTEIGPVWYDAEGFVGMASAGFDTEGTQWFVTHSPAPHLDGRYTIFGRITQGMEVVHQMQVGDMVENVKIQ